MTEEAQRIAITKECGWQKAPYNETDYYVPMLGKRFVACDPFNDLNATHEAERILLKGAAIHSYFDRLVGEIAGSCSNPRHDDYPRVISATAPQRVEAILHTIGKWVE